MVRVITDGIKQSAIRCSPISLAIEGAWKRRTDSRVADFMDLIIQVDIIESDLGCKR